MDDGQKLKHGCTMCSRSFSTKRELVKHQYMHREKPNYLCSHCNRTFATEANYRRHLNAVQNTSQKKWYICNNCGSSFRRLRELESHHESEHRDDKVFRCKVCHAEFSWHENLLKHEQVHGANSHVCSVCQKEFIDLTSLLVHRRTHHPPSPATKQARAAAAVAVSSPDKPFTCHICGRGFKFDFSYQAHLDAHVVPAGEEKTSVSYQAVSNPSTSKTSKQPIYVQMSSEGIIDLPALSGSNNEEVEIIVEVGNIPQTSLELQPEMAQGYEVIDSYQRVDDAGLSVVSISNTTEKTMADAELPTDVKTEEKLPGVGEDSKPYDTNLRNVNNHSEIQQYAHGNSEPIIGNGGTSSQHQRAEDATEPPVIERIDIEKLVGNVLSNYSSYISRPKKPQKRKRERAPFQFNCVMTDDKPFVCDTCGLEFRWEISLQVHTKIHTEGKVPGIRKMYNSSCTAEKRKGLKGKEKMKNGNKLDSAVKGSRIVYRRDSSDEEEEEEDVEDMFTFGNQEEDEVHVGNYQGRKYSEKRLGPENADDMLQEYLGGQNSFIMHPEPEVDMIASVKDDQNISVDEEKVLTTKLTKRFKNGDDGRQEKGKAILKKKSSYKFFQQKTCSRIAVKQSESKLLDQGKSFEADITLGKNTVIEKRDGVSSKQNAESALDHSVDELNEQKHVIEPASEQKHVIETASTVLPTPVFVLNVADQTPLPEMLPSGSACTMVDGAASVCINEKDDCPAAATPMISEIGRAEENANLLNLHNVADSSAERSSTDEKLITDNDSTKKHDCQEVECGTNLESIEISLINTALGHKYCDSDSEHHRHNAEVPPLLATNALSLDVSCISASSSQVSEQSFNIQLQKSMSAVSCSKSFDLENTKSETDVCETSYLKGSEQSARLRIPSKRHLNRLKDHAVHTSAVRGSFYSTPGKIQCLESSVRSEETVNNISNCKCTICGKYFSSKLSLKRHRDRHRHQRI